MKTFKEILTEAGDVKNIKVTNPGILEVPDGKNIMSLPVSHFVALAKKKGVGAIVKALLNLYRWNENDNPKLSKWAKSTQEAVSVAMKKEEK